MTASIAEIAKRSGLPKANVYYYFGSKETIYRTIIGDLIGEWDRALDQLDPAREPAEAIADAIRAKLDFSRKHAALSRMVAYEAVHGGRFITRKDRAHMLALTLEKTKVFEAWAAAGMMDPVDPSTSSSCCGATQYYATSTCWRRATCKRRGSAPTTSIAPPKRSPHRAEGCGIVPRGQSLSAPRSAARLRG
jgi:AcrR family transcriptional regulator